MADTLMTTSVGPTNAIRTQYIGKYLRSVGGLRLYDQLAVPYTQFSGGLGMSELMQGSSIQINFSSGLQPGTTAISETADVTPQVIRDATNSVTPTSRGEAVQWSENLGIQAYTDYADATMEAVGKNAGESIDLLAQAVALQGSWVERAAARASLDAGTVSHRASDSIFRQAQIKLLRLKAPGFVTDDGKSQVWACIMPPEPFHDISESGNVNDIGLYQDKGIHLNWELAQIGNFRLVVSPFAKVFGGAGVDNATACTTTLSADHDRLTTSVLTTDNKATESASGDWIWIGNEETANTHNATNEAVKMLSAVTTTLTVAGSGPNAGLMYDHASGVAVRNADSVFPMVFGGPQSLVKVFATDVGEYGEIVGPKDSGLLEQWTHVGWKYYGNYGLLSQNRLVRWEVSTSYEA
jgi:N4-gp56 family major capsid protein